MPPRKWKESEGAADRRNRILAIADAKGLTHRQIAEAVGLKGNAGQIRFHRWTRGEARLDEEQVSAMERYLATPLAPGVDGDEASTAELTDDAVASVVEQLARLAGEIPEDEVDGDVMRFLARRHAPAIFGQALRLMVGAKSESVRADMVRFLKETGFGKAIQAFEDKTPKPPMEDDDFLDAVHRMIDAEKARRESAGLPVPVVPGDGEKKADDALDA